MAKEDWHNFFENIEFIKPPTRSKRNDMSQCHEVFQIGWEAAS